MRATDLRPRARGRFDSAFPHTAETARGMEQELYRHVPYDIDVEQALLGAIIVDNRAIERVSAQLRPEHFYDPLHQRLFEAMAIGCERGGMVITPLTLHAQLKADPGLIEVGGMAYLANLAAAAPALPNVRDYALILHDLWVRRALISIGEDIVNTAYEAPLEKPPRAQIEQAEKALYNVAETSKYGDGPLDFAEALQPCGGIRRNARNSAAVGFPVFPADLPTSIRFWADCSLPIFSFSPDAPAPAKLRWRQTWRSMRHDFMPRMLRTG